MPAEQEWHRMRVKRMSRNEKYAAVRWVDWICLFEGSFMRVEVGASLVWRPSPELSNASIATRLRTVAQARHSSTLWLLFQITTLLSLSRERPFSQRPLINQLVPSESILHHGDHHGRGQRVDAQVCSFLRHGKICRAVRLSPRELTVE